MKQIHYIQSSENYWRIWITTNLVQKEHERFRDRENNFPFIVPPTTYDRIDIYEPQQLGYSFDFNKCVIVIKQGKIEQIIYKQN